MVTCNERTFQGVWIPKEIWLDKELTALEKVILVEINSLNNAKDGCYATNKYLSEFCQCSKSKITKAISKLAARGYLVASYDERNCRIIKSALASTTGRGNENPMGVVKSTRGVVKSTRGVVKSTRGGSKKYDHNNINNNIKNNKEKNKIKKETPPRKEIISQTEKKQPSRFVPPTLDEVTEYCVAGGKSINPEQFVSYYTSNGWKVGKSPMKNWKAAVRTWELRNRGMEWNRHIAVNQSYERASNYDLDAYEACSIFDNGDLTAKDLERFLKKPAEPLINELISG